MGKPILHDVIHAHALSNMLGEFTCKTGMSKKEVRYSYRTSAHLF